MTVVSPLSISSLAQRDTHAGQRSLSSTHFKTDFKPCFDLEPANAQLQFVGGSISFGGTSALINEEEKIMTTGKSINYKEYEENKIKGKI